MRHLTAYILILSGIFFTHIQSNAQLIEKAEKIIHTAINETTKDTLQSPVSENILPEDKLRQDSIRMEELALQIQEMKLNEIVLRAELDNAKNLNATADSLKREEQRHRIDSLRSLTSGVPVIVDNDTLFTLYAKRGGHSPHDRAESINNIVLKIGKSKSLSTDSVYAFESEYYVDVMYGDKVIVSITDQDALWQNTTRFDLANQYVPILQNKINELKKENSLQEIAKRAALFILVLVIQYLLFRLTNYLFRKLRRQIIWLKQNKLKSIIVRDYEFLNTHRQGRVLIFLSNILRYIVLLIQLTFSVPMLFAIFPQTEKLALKIFLYIIDPVKMVLKSIAEYIPNLFIILVIYYCIKYLSLIHI